MTTSDAGSVTSIAGSAQETAPPPKKEIVFKTLRADLVATIQNKHGEEAYPNHIIFDHPDTDETLRKASAADIKAKKISKGDEVFLFDPETDQQVRGTVVDRPDGKPGTCVQVYWGTLCYVSVSVSKEEINAELNKDMK